MSMPRFLVVLFPLASGWRPGWPSTRGCSVRRSSLSVALMVFFVAQFATWHWVA